jgi:ankyrin repeat protein
MQEMTNLLRDCPEQFLIRLDESPEMIHLRDEDDRTLLHQVCGYAPYLIPELIKRGADVEAETNDKRRPIHMACRKSSLAAYFLIESGVELNVEDIRGNTPLLEACCDLPDVVPLLLKKGANVHHRHKQEESTVLHFVCERYGYTIRYLLDAGANIHARRKDGKTPLLIACKSGHLDHVKLLDKRGANLNDVDLDGNGVFHHAVRWDIEVLTYLLDKNLDIDRVNHEGNSALHLACMYKETGCVKLLLVKGADPNLKNKKGKTPFDLAPDLRHLVKKRRRDEPFQAMELTACVVCLERNRTMRLDPCGHFVSCSECSEKMETCPICREKITDKMVVYL